MIRNHRLLLLGVAALLASCASSAELARRSVIALQGGNPDEAYDWARRSLEKDPGNPRARAAMHEAVQLVSDQWKSRIRELAATDTVAAARLTLEFEEFRGEAVRYGAPMDPDSAWSADERAMRAGAGRIRFADGDSSLADGRPKRAWDEFTESARFDPRRRDLDDRIRESLDRATTRVAILPLDNETGRGGLGTELTSHWQERLVQKVQGSNFRFTRLVPANDVRGAIEGRHLSRVDAIRIAQRLGAQQVLWGRIYGLESDTHTDTFHDLIYRKTVTRDREGNTIVRWQPVPFEAVSRDREVNVSLEVELVAVTDGRSLFARESDFTRRARTAWTSFQATGACADYCLVPESGGEGVDLDRAKAAESSWKAEMPEGVKLASFLEHARSERGRQNYQPQNRDWFMPSGPAWVFLDDLPPPGDLAYCALEGEWHPVLDALTRFEPLDEVDIGRAQ